MRRIFQRAASVFFILTSIIGYALPVRAQQFSILPYTNKTQDQCKSIMDLFEVNPKIPTAQQVASQDFKTASDAFDKAAQAAAGKDCTPDSTDSACQAVASAQKAKDDAFMAVLEATVKNPDQRADLLGCGIKTGRITLMMIPYYITYFTNFLLGLGGSITVLFIVLGGYRYVLGGLTEEKEKGKQTIYHALLGFGVALLAWAIVNIVIGAVTG